MFTTLAAQPEAPGVFKIRKPWPLHNLLKQVLPERKPTAWLLVTDITYMGGGVGPDQNVGRGTVEKEEIRM